MANLKMKFGFDTDNLVTYVDQSNLELYKKAVFNNATSEYLNGQVQSGIKYKEQINYMDVDVFLRAKEGCGLTSSGDVIFDKKEIQVYPFYDQKTFCPSDLETFYTQQFLPQGSTYENMPIEQAFAEYYSAKVAAAVEVLLWQGVTGGASGVIGFNQIIDAASPINGNPTSIAVGTGITTGAPPLVELLPAIKQHYAELDSVEKFMDDHWRVISICTNIILMLLMGIKYYFFFVFLQGWIFLRYIGFATEYFPHKNRVSIQDELEHEKKYVWLFPFITSTAYHASHHYNARYLILGPGITKYFNIQYYFVKLFFNIKAKVL
jgi:hypothetical protein